MSKDSDFLNKPMPESAYRQAVIRAGSALINAGFDAPDDDDALRVQITKILGDLGIGKAESVQEEMHG